jgi:hypothetical protein
MKNDVIQFLWSQNMKSSTLWEEWQFQCSDICVSQRKFYEWMEGFSGKDVCWWCELSAAIGCNVSWGWNIDWLTCVSSATEDSPLWNFGWNEHGSQAVQVHCKKVRAYRRPTGVMTKLAGVWKQMAKAYPNTKCTSIFQLKPCHSSVGYSPAFHRGGLGSRPRQSIWDSWGTKWQRDRLFSESISFHTSSVLDPASSRWLSIGPLTVAVSPDNNNNNISLNLVQK